MDSFLLGLLAGYGIAVPVGAIAVLILEIGLRRGFRLALAAGSGAASADLFYAGLAAFGGNRLAAQLEPWRGTLQLAGGAALVTIGILRLRRAWVERSMPAGRVDSDGWGATYAQLLGLTLLNPQTVVYFAALVIGGGARLASSQDSLAFTLGAGLASLSWQWLLAGIAGLGRTRLPAWAKFVAALAGSLIVIGFGFRMVARLA